VPYGAAHTWENMRIEVAICGVMALIVEGFIYFAFGLG
jgi:hypothetical protein